MKNFGAYMKWWVTLAGVIATVIVVALPAAGVPVPAWLTIVVAVLTSVGVRQAVNAPLDPSE